jgi:hypothetical protein
MKVTCKQILQRLPPYRDQWELVKDRQYVPDIMEEILRAHREFGGYYDKFSSLFFTTDLDALADNLFYFCKGNIAYREENERRQTTALPTGFLTRGYGDCKHYALFSAGVLDSLNRQMGLGLDWWYCFAGYDGADEPYHVFVAMRDAKGGEVWIDPTPGAASNVPTLLIKRKP